MTDLIYEDQSASALRLNLMRGAVDKDTLTVLCTGKIDLSYGRLNAGIIGASHYIEFVQPDGSVLFTEVFACTDLNDSGDRMFYGDVVKATDFKTTFDSIDYHFDVQCTTYKESHAQMTALERLIKDHTKRYRIGLSYLFPESEEDEFSPMTLVSVSADPQTLAVDVKTLHAYPNEGSLVFTETNIQPNREVRNS